MKRSISRPLIGLSSSSTPLPTEGTITCAICQATYAPSRIHAYLLQAPPIALESAFINMCHFCFRCRRPSCPNCWDAVHSICGQCAHETHIPFRTPISPLEGTTLISSRPNFSADDHALSSSLIPIHPGRFQEPPSLSTQSAGTVVTSPVSRSHHTPPDIDAVITRPERSKPLDVDEVATRPDHHTSSDIDAIATRPDRRNKSLNVDEVATRPAHSRNRKPKFMRNLLLSLLLIVVLLIVVIVASLFLESVNASMYALLHIDIRAELTVFWHLLRSFF